MKRIVLVDDEAPARDELRYLLNRSVRADIVGEGTNGFEAVALCRRLRPDILFLDIQMPGKNGLEAAREIVEFENPPVIIFQTAYDEYALEAFEVHAMDYLLKPLSPARLEETLKRAERKSPAIEQLEALLNDLSRTEKHAYPSLALFRGDTIIPIRQEEILFAEARGKEVRLATKRGDFFQNKPFRQIEDQLSHPDFFRCHRSYAVNLTYVEQVDLGVNNTYLIKIYGREERIPVSRGKIGEFREIFHI
jgi:DNA-binding LytR/AlgR family response regulator